MTPHIVHSFPEWDKLSGNCSAGSDSRVVRIDSGSLSRVRDTVEVGNGHLRIPAILLVEDTVSVVTMGLEVHAGFFLVGVTAVAQTYRALPATASRALLNLENNPVPARRKRLRAGNVLIASQTSGYVVCMDQCVIGPHLTAIVRTYRKPWCSP